MFSLLIPTYRYDVRPLVKNLLAQLPDLRVQYPAAGEVEIRVYDDGSPAGEDYGQAELAETPGIVYRVLPQNLGRAAIRNLLVQDAKKEWCLLLDADAGVGDFFLEGWWEALEHEYAPDPDPSLNYLPRKRMVFVGGRKYAPVPPDDPALHLHWNYGTYRESDAGMDVEENPAHFQSNNFLAHRDLLLAHPFDGAHTGYGHEDTLWGLEVAAAGYGFYYVAEEVVHLGLEPAEVFLAKQREAVLNLRSLRKIHPHLRTRLTDFAEKWSFLKPLVLRVPTDALYAQLAPTLRPRLWALDLLKLRWFWEEPRG